MVLLTRGQYFDCMNTLNSQPEHNKSVKKSIIGSRNDGSMTLLHNEKAGGSRVELSVRVNMSNTQIVSADGHL